MTKIYTLFLLLIGFISNAQVSIQGKIVERGSNEPVISASIGVKSAATGTISNEEGSFQLSVPQSATIVISCLGYQTIEIKVEDFSDAIKTIFLEQSEEKLEEVLVTKVPLHEMLSEAIFTSTVRFNKPILLHTYYREFAKSNGKYSRFSDGMLDYHVGGNTKKTTTDLVLVQNRSFNLATPEEQDDDLGSILSVQSAVSSNYSMSYLYKNIIESKNFKNYDFQLKSKKEGERELFIISFEPKTEIEKSLYEGTVTFDRETKLIQDITINSAPSHLQYGKTINLLIAKIAFLDARIKIAYKMVGNNYVLSYNKRYWKIKIFNKKNSELLESYSDLLVVDFEKEQPYDKKARFKGRNLHDAPTKYKRAYWKENNAIVLTADQEKIISDLEKSSADLNKAN